MMRDGIFVSRSRGRARAIRSRLKFRGSTLILGLWALGITLPLHPAHAEYRVAPDVVVFCEPTLQHAMTDLAALWRKETGIAVRIFTSPTPALLQQVLQGARSDVVIGEGESAAGAAGERHLIKPTTVEHLWRNHLVVAARRANDHEKGTPVSLAATAGQEPIAIVDAWAASAGAATEEALQALGLWQRVRDKSVGVVGTEDAVYLLNGGEVRLAVVYATDVIANPELSVNDKLPLDNYGPITYWVAQTEHALSPNTEKFIAFLRAPQARVQAQVDGLEVLP